MLNSRTRSKAYFFGNARIPLAVMLSAAIFVIASMAGSQSAYSLTLTPDSCGTTFTEGTNCWTTDVNSALSQAEVEAIIGLDITDYESYKDNVESGEEGALAGSYETTFANTPTDPEDALIKWVGPDKVSLPTLLIIKDGNQDPAQYLFLLTSLDWDGMMDLIMEDFWPAQGAISYVSLSAVVPLPAALPLFATALGGLGFVGWRRRRKAAAIA